MENMETPPLAPHVNTVEDPPAQSMDLNLLATESQEILASLLRLLAFEVKLSSTIEQGSLRIQLECEDAGRLIGRKGATVNELQFLLNRILQRRHEFVPRIFLDVDGPLEKEKEPSPAQPAPIKPAPVQPSPVQLPPVQPPPVELKPDEKLIQRVKEIAAQVHRWGDPVELGTLNTAERKIVQEQVAMDRELEAVSLEPAADPSRPQKMQLRVREKNAPPKR